MVALKRSEWSSATPLTLREPAYSRQSAEGQIVKEGGDRTDNGEISHTDLFGVTFLDQRHAGESLRVTRELLLDTSQEYP